MRMSYQLPLGSPAPWFPATLPLLRKAVVPCPQAWLEKFPQATSSRPTPRSCGSPLPFHRRERQVQAGGSSPNQHLTPCVCSQPGPMVSQQPEHLSPMKRRGTLPWGAYELANKTPRASSTCSHPRAPSLGDEFRVHQCQNEGSATSLWRHLEKTHVCVSAPDGARLTSMCLGRRRA